MSMINSLDCGDGAHTFTLPYGVCSTAAATAEKTVTVDNFSLETGAVVIVKFTNANSIASPTLNVNDTGAKPIVRYGTTVVSTGTTTTGWTAGAVQLFVYDGTSWVRDYWSNTTYSNASLGSGYATCSTAEATVAKTASLSSYALTTGGIVAVKFTYAVPASATLNINSKGAKAIYHKGAAIKAGVIKAGNTATFIYNGTYYHLISVDRMAEEDGLKYEKKTYTGTGKSGSGNKNSITFSFVPKMVIVHQMSGTTFSLSPGGIVWLNGAPEGMTGTLTTSGDKVTLKWSNKTVSWYHDDDEEVQLNNSGQSYAAIAIG